ncbi:TPA: phage tail protein [Streptococcus suis]|uniref:Phage tail spike protein n=3 Tax=Streptococcus suis TaxID=1307 RepID=A0AAP6DVG7_STRSU|nr:phage tail spike protein [Streptococcus suis]QBX30522.1 hyaluronidase [Streptococcus phage Javan548]MCB2907190.1 phage tail protein [Streptococcus suis]MCO0824780.1 gp58-like family protein [Streptococcus suis]MCO0826819.1 gp58-like family protein [Streptococcus suis]MCO0845395.1 gp58-like family protein [Streptococcus suis]
MIYLKDGNIPLNLAYDDDIVQEANSTYQLSFKFPLTDGKWNLLKKEVFLLADDLHGEQEFFIFEAKKANGYVQVYAKQVATLLNYYSVNTISVDRVPGQTVMTALAGSVKRPCPFTFFSDILDRHTFNESNVSVMDALVKEKHSILGQWGGDLVRDKYQIKLLKNGGIENESLFMYKKNLSSYEESENINNLKTRLHLKKTIQGQSEGEADRAIAVTVDSPLIGQYRQIYEADIEVNDQDVTDEASLLAYGQRYFGSTLCDLVENSINLDVKGKSDVSVKMFDTVSVFHERFDVDLRLKITSYHFAPMSKRLKSIGFGKVSQSFGSTVASMVAGSVDKATGRLSASFEQKLQKEIDNANRHFDAEFNKRVESINDGIEQSKAEAEAYADNIKQQIDGQLAESDRQYQLAQQVQDRQIADVLAEATSAKEIAEQTVTDLMRVRNAFNQSIGQANTKALELERSIGTVRTDVMSQAQTILAQAQTQTELTNRVASVETTANSTKMTVSELSKTVSKATGDIASVTSRTKTVEDNLSQTRTQYEALTQTVSAQTGQIESINRKTADLQSGIDGVTERFESLRVGGENLLTGTADFSGSWLNSYSWTREAEKYRGLTVMSRSGEWLGISQSYASEINETYTFSCYIKSSVETDTVICYFAHPITGNPAAVSINSRSISVSNVWKRISVTFSVTRAGNIFPRIERFDRNARVYIAGLKLERGTVATDWSHSDEDLRSEMATYKRTAEETSAELSRQIQMADGKAVEAKSYAQQTATAINTRLESLETYKNAEGTRASQYFTASRDETARQVTALRTAVTDGYVAKARYEEDARGVTQRFEELSSATDTKIAAYKNTVDGRFATLQSQKANQVDLQTVRETVNLYERIIGSTETGIKDKVARMVMTDSLFLTEVKDKISGTATQVSQLNNSYAIKNLTSAGTVLNQINLLANGTNRIDGRLTHITGQTLIDNGVINNAMIGNLDAGKITTGYLASARIATNSITGSHMVFDQAFVDKMTANEALFKQLFAQSAFITSVQAVAVSAKQIAGGIAKALNGGMDVNFDESKINFYTNVAAIRRIYTGHPTQFIKFETEGNYSRTIIGSNRNGGEVFNSATFAGVVVENTNNINTEDSVKIYGDNTLLRHAQGDVGWNINSVTQRIVPANINAESEIWSKHFVAPDKNSKPVRLDTAVAALWDIWNHIIYNNFEFNEALRTHIKARRDNWKFELNL